jgi:hypothetical protein
MKPIKFKEQNTMLGRPKCMTDEECISLPCFRDGTEVISKWKLTTEDIEHINIHGYIWVRILSGESQPPVCIEAKENIFQMVDCMYVTIPSEIR